MTNETTRATRGKSGLGSRPSRPPAPLLLGRVFRDARLVVIGGTGFLGKVWWVLMLDRFPELGQLYLVVRPRNGQTAEQRFFNDIATSECLTPLRERHGERFDAFLREKITVLDGDIVQPFCGLSERWRSELRGKVSAVVNASGIVDFQPPLDIALEVNAFGMQSLVALARDLGNVPVLHTSTCYVAGNRPGIVEELNPLDFPFPNAARLDPNLWDPDREIAECLDIIEQAKHRANDAFRESHFLDQAKRNLVEAGEPAKGAVLEAEIARVRRKFVEQQLAAFGQERAKFWGWPNTYTYTKSIGEQIVAKSNLPFTIVRPAIVESCTKFPLVGWNEGVNTSAPLIFAVREGQFQFPGAAIRLDIIPCDLVATGITLALGELLDGSQKPVYQFGTSDSNPTTMARIYELSGLYKRRYWQSSGRGGPVTSFLQAHLEGALMPSKRFDQLGPRAISRGASLLADLLDRVPRGPFEDMIAPSKQTLRKVARQQSKIADVVGQFSPFTADLDYEFRCDNTRAANARLSEEERQALFWAPESIDWRAWFLEVHVPGLERWVFPELEKRLRRPLAPLKRHATLGELLEEMAERHELAVALQRTEADGLSRISYREWYERSLACAARLEGLGVVAGDRVVLCARNHPDWPICFFGILLAGATVVPLGSELERPALRAALEVAQPKAILVDEATKSRLVGSFGSHPLVSTSEAAAVGPMARPRPASAGDVAVLAHTSGRSGPAKPVLLSHENLTSLVAQLAPLFPLSKSDRLLSVLPLHQLYELTAGLLLPMSRGARVVYLSDEGSERIERALRDGLITSVVAVPEVWQRLQHEIEARVREHGRLAMRAFDLGLELNRLLGGKVGVDVGRLLFGSVHAALGGRLRTLVSGGAALDPKTQSWFAGLGLHLAQGYGLTEASPVVSVSSAGPRSRPGQVGRAIPGVEVKIDAPDEHGVGEVLVRGPNVMLGYATETERAVDEVGWLHTGDRGHIDSKGRLFIDAPEAAVEEAATPAGPAAARVDDTPARDGAAHVGHVTARVGDVAPADVSARVNLGPLAPVFEELEARFEPGAVKAPVSYYFSIGSERFTLKLTESAYLLEKGRTVERADCVLRTSPDLFRRMVMEGYTPGVREVVTGAIKSNNVRALQDLRRIFQLGSRGRRASNRRAKARPAGAP